MRILVVHDRVEVAAEIEAVIRDVSGPQAMVDKAVDGVGARQALREGLYDLLIIDITIPQITGRTEVDVRTADELLAELFLLDTLRKPGDIIGITRELDALVTVSNNLGVHMMAILEERPDTLWKKQLADKIKYAKLASDSRIVSVNQHYWYDALVVTALDEEFTPFREMFELAPAKTYRRAETFTFTDKQGQLRTGAAFAIGQSGQASAASITQSLISFFRPSAVIMSGFCGGVEGESSIGDIVLFEQAYDWDYGKWRTPKDNPDAPVFQARPYPIPIGDGRMRDAVRQFLGSNFAEPDYWGPLKSELERWEDDKRRVVLKSAASGSSVVGHKQIVEQIFALNGNIRAIDMEAYGVYHAADHTHVRKPEFICIKTVADYADGDKGDKYHPIACFRSAEATRIILTKFMDFG